MSVDSDSDGENQSEQEVLLSMYDQHRQEIRSHGKRKNRRYMGSLTVLGIIIGYVFTTNGDGRVLVIAPYVLGFLYLSHISSMHYVTQLAALVALIEAELDHFGAEYEFFHGGFSIRPSPQFRDIRDKYLDEFKHAAKNENAQELHQDIQKYVRNSMRGIALGAYIVPMIIGTCLLYSEGVPSAGGGFLSMFPILFWIGVGLIVVTQLGLLISIVVAWRKYRDHKDVLRAGVLEATLEGELERNIERLEGLDTNE